ncbi:MAG: excinuclease ABC subunit UvrA [Prevotellaceae bacterium]|jgi:excinuclease ABC subunit A|nr:excinuclease ABC subunit UvrA [Prevotellaceae bacterium]
MPSNASIEIKNACVHNLKGVDLAIPRNKLVVITGLSGSGKSSLAFDTLYAEGQRRYVESLSAYVRQFLGRMNKPEVDYIKGLPPSIAIRQKVISSNVRSTVGTSTEIYDYLKLLFARIGHTFSPVSGNEITKDSISDVVDAIMQLKKETAVFLLAPIIPVADRTLAEHLDLLARQGFSRIEINGEIMRFTQLPERQPDMAWNDQLHLLIDRIMVDHSQETKNRLADSVQTAFFEGNNKCVIAFRDDEDNLFRKTFSQAFEADGITFEEPSERMFSFNNPVGACPACGGCGKSIGIDPDLVIPDKSLSIYDDAVACWRGEVMNTWKNTLIYNTDKFDFPIHKPYNELSKAQQKLLWTGNDYFKGIDDFFKFIESQQSKIQYRVMLARYRGMTVCSACNGTRLKTEAQYVHIGGKSITQLVDMPITGLQAFFANLQLPARDVEAGQRLLVEITSRLNFMVNVGLGYLTLNRPSNTLSGGESQRINLATSLGSALVGSLYVLDEPSIGLHARDTARLITVLRRLQALGNTVVVVEHDSEMIKAADYLVDMGPLAGSLGGNVVYCGIPQESSPADIENSCTLKYLTGNEQIPVPKKRRRWTSFIEVKRASHNNLKNINVRFPIGVMTVVTGVSGSGKSSLVRDVLYSGLQGCLGSGITDAVPLSGQITGSLHLISSAEFVNQNAIGKTSRSNPATYSKAFDEIRRLFAEQPLAKQMGFSALHFSFNQEGGRCETCLGTGVEVVPMQFMADLELECDACHGRRFKADVLEVRYLGKHIHDILEMTIDQAIAFFEKQNGNMEKRIVKRLRPLQEVGIGYIKLGQASNTLSGGENQRVKLASFLSGETQSPMLFIFDEPTTGLHAHDIKTLLGAFNALLKRGHTVLIIEHNLDVIKSADHVIDIGPEGGEEGGYLVAEGTPEQIAACLSSHTGNCLRPLLAV